VRFSSAGEIVRGGAEGESAVAALRPSHAGLASPVRLAHRVAAYVELMKPRITVLIVLVSAAAFWLASGGRPDAERFATAMIAIGCLAGGMFALNQYLERDVDALMRRTRLRPLPTCRVTARQALCFGVSMSAVALAALALLVNVLAAILGLLTLASYLFLYTPLKKITPHCTLIGAFPGAMPPLLGWAAAAGELGWGAWVLFATLFFWQFPHFHSIAFLYRDEYARADIRLWAVVEPSGKTTGRQILAGAAMLLLVSVVPSIIGLSGTLYAWAAVALGAGFLWLGFRAALVNSSARAQQLLLGSVVYLPILLALMVMDRSELR
jgi:heme o synthase